MFSVGKDAQLLDQIESHFQRNQYVEVENMLNQYPDKPELIVSRIKLSRSTADYNRALSTIDNYLNKNSHQPQELAEVYIELAHCYWYLDKKDELLSVLEKVDKILSAQSLNLRTKRIKANYLHLKAIGAKNMSTFDKTIELLKESIELKKETNMVSDLALSYNNIGYYYWMQNNFDDAIENLQLSYRINTLIDNEEQIALNLLNLLQVSVAKSEISQAVDYLKELEDVYRTNQSNVLVRTYYYYCTGLIQTHETNLRKKLEAEDIFDSIIDSEFVISSLYTKSIFNLCLLYLFQLRISYDDGIFQKLVERIRLLYDFGLDTNMGLTIQKAEFLQGKIFLLKEDFTNAKSMFLKLVDDVALYGDKQMAKLVGIELEQILDREKLADTSKSLNANLADSNLEDLLSNFITNTSPKLPEFNEEPVSVIILTQDGNQIFSLHLDEQVELNTFLVSSFISAVNSFGNQVFGNEQGGLEKIQHQSYTILLRRKDKIIYCYIFKGETNMSVIRLNSIIEEIHDIVNEIGEVIMITHDTKQLLETKISAIFEFNDQQIQS